MNQGRTVFSQLISFLPDREFRRCVERYRGDLRLRDFTCWNQYLAMVFAQLTYLESLRDIEACLGSLQGKLYHLGFHGKVARSTLADANESRDWRIFADFAHRLIATARRLYASEPMGVALDPKSYFEMCGFRGAGQLLRRTWVLNRTATVWMSSKATTQSVNNADQDAIVTRSSLCVRRSHIYCLI